jgi:ubiquinone/menaquinone biosynthesis C-methylase UbiE
MKSSSKITVDRFPQYNGSEWDRKINDPNHPNFWKYGVANLIFLEQVRGKNVILDLGCGTGGSTFFLAEHDEVEWIIGVDLVKDMIQVAKKNAVKRGLNQKTCFLICDGRYLPFKASCFEALISRGDAFCFLVPLKRTIQELRRIMKQKGVIVLEIDNRAEWKPNTIISTGFQKRQDGKVAYVKEIFTATRNHKTISYILKPESKIARKVAGDLEFKQKGYKAWEYSLQKIRGETIEVRKGVSTHWPTAKGLYRFFKKTGFTEIQVMGDGLLMKLLLDGDKTIIEAMKRYPQVFFEVEKRLVQFLNPNKSPTMILRVTVQ